MSKSTGGNVHDFDAIASSDGFGTLMSNSPGSVTKSLVVENGVDHLRVSNVIQGSYANATAFIAIDLTSATTAGPINLAFKVRRRDEVPVNTALVATFLDESFNIETAGVIASYPLEVMHQLKPHWITLTVDVPPGAKILKIFMGTSPSEVTSKYKGEELILDVLKALIIDNATEIEKHSSSKNSTDR